MKELTRLAVLYSRIDTFLEGDRVAPSAQASEANQILNDQAYLLLCWGRLEIEIDSTCRAAIRRRSVDPNWQTRRSWYLYTADDKRLSGLSFEDRAALVLDRTAGRGSPHAKAMTYDETRNRIAHGKLEATRIDLTSFIQDRYVVPSALDRAA